MRSASEGRDWFPVTLFATFVGFAASAVLLMLLGHGWLAMATTGAATLVALPLGGWLVAGQAVEGFLVYRLRAAGGWLPEPAVREDAKTVDRLAQRGVVRVGDGIVALQEENVGRVFNIFVKLYSRGRRRARGSDRPN